MTDEERKCLTYLDDKMWATGRMIGEAIAPGRARSPRGYAMIGNAVARRLMLGSRWTAFLSDVSAWRITPAGRAALSEPEGGQTRAAGVPVKEVG